MGDNPAVPSTVADLLHAADLQPSEAVPWGTSPATTLPGVYLVSLLEDPHELGQPTDPVFDPEAIQRLLNVCPGVELDGMAGPTAGQLTERLSASWTAEEPVLYIGKADVPLAKRVKQYYRTPIGARSPHKGGWFLKMLANLDTLWVHCAASTRPKDDEETMLSAFADGLSAASRGRLRVSTRPMPYANLQRRTGGPKDHGIRNATIPR